MKKALFALVCIAPLLLCRCSTTYELKSQTFFAMNTFVTVSTAKESTAEEIKALTDKYEKLFSRTLPQSEISILNNDGSLVAKDDTLLLLDKAVQVAKATDGAYNPCMGSVVSLWDISSGKNNVPDSEAVAKALVGTSFENLCIDDNGVSLLQRGTQIDLGGIAKGYALDKAYDKARELGEENFCISFGGNVGVHGSSPSSLKTDKTGWNVGITNPFDKEKTLGTLLMTEGFISVSGAYERYFKKDGKIYHHIFDPKTGYPSESDIACACVVSTDAALGDALSTAMFVMGSDRAREFYKSGQYDFDMILILNDKSILVSDELVPLFSLSDTENFKVKQI